MARQIRRRLLAAIMLSVVCMQALAYDIDYTAGMALGAGTGDFAPSYIAALRHGTLTQASNALIDLGFSHKMDTTRRFSYDFGFSAWGGYQSSVNYMRYDDVSAGQEPWTSHSLHPKRLWLQELYGSVKYRGVFFELGMRNQGSPFLNPDLTGGDLIQSGNARPMPGVRAGFINFQNIPFTDGWVQIEGQIFYGKYIDNSWWADHANHFNSHVTDGQWAIYRRCYFRTKPHKRFSVTIGVQCASQFGGTTRYYSKGKVYKTESHPARFKDFVKMFWPGEGSGESFYMGNTLGSWDFKARYRLHDESEVKFYFQWPWEDGSGMGKLNGFDGLWGVEYDFSKRSRFVKAVAVEFLDLTNQSGPMHWDPEDNPGTTLGSHAQGADDYYNNAFYNPYACFGMGIGSPVVMSPLYNRDGYMLYVGNRISAVHFAVTGNACGWFDYRVKIGYRRALGNGYVQLTAPMKSTSMLIEGSRRLGRVPGLSLNLQVGFDTGNMPRNAFGALLTVRYDGTLRLNKKH